MKLLTIFLWLNVVFSAILGIDYGHQFTKAVLLAPGIQFEILLTEEAKRKDLSGLAIRSQKDDGLERIYGSGAQSLCSRFPSTCVTGVKSLLGKSINDPSIQQYLAYHFGIKLIPDDDRSNGIKFDFGFSNQSYMFSVEELFAMNLNALKSRALTTLNDNPIAKPLVDDVAISIPPFVSQEVRQAYVDSLELAGFPNILNIVDDGSAVAINYASNLKFEQKDFDDLKRYYMIYDMGAGSTKATLFSITPFKNLTTKLEFESIGYDDTFGGLALTNSIYSILVEKLASAFGFDENKELPIRASARLMEAAEKAKIILSANGDYHLSIESIMDDRDFRTVVTREEFEEINMDMMNRVTQPVMDALSEHNLKINDVNSVILTGGSTRVPFVQKHLSLLLGDERIAKTVNADESCALGTTFKAFKSKTQFDTNKDIEIVEKSYHNYEINVDDDEQDTIIFSKGSTIDKDSRISLGELSDSKKISLLEDGRIFKTFNIDKILEKTNSLTCNDDDSYKKELFGVFTLDGSKIFNLKKLEAECVKPEKDGFFKKLLNKDSEQVEEEEEEEEVNTEKEASNETDTKEANRKSRKVLRPIQVSLPRPQYSILKPLSKPLKERMSEKLAYLNAKDEFKAELDLIKNQLEASCYQVRNYIEDNEDKISHEVPVDEIRSEISETIEWLEFESDDSSIEEFKNKINLIKQRKLEIDAALKMTTTDLSLEGLNKLYNDGTSIMMKIQSRMIELGGEISEVRQKYDSEGFEFDKENDRVKIQLLNKGEDRMMKLDRTLAKYKDLITHLGEIVSYKPNKFEKLSKFELYKTYEAISECIVDMLSDLVMIEESHKERLELFNSKFDKLIERRQQKETREKAKQEKAAAEAAAKAAKAEEAEEAEAAEDHTQAENADNSEQASSVNTDSNASKSSESSKDSSLDHDEL